MSDILKLLRVISRAARRVKFETILKCHEWYLCQKSHTNHAIICLYFYPQRFCNFLIQVFQIKLKYHCSKPIKLQKFLMQQYKYMYSHSFQACYQRRRKSLGELIFFVNNSCDYILNWAPLSPITIIVFNNIIPPPPSPFDTGSLCYVKHIITCQFLLCIVAIMLMAV